VRYVPEADWLFAEAVHESLCGPISELMIYPPDQYTVNDARSYDPKVAGCVDSIIVEVASTKQKRARVSSGRLYKYSRTEKPAALAERGHKTGELEVSCVIYSPLPPLSYFSKTLIISERTSTLYYLTFSHVSAWSPSFGIEHSQC
jgi:hypothetical protein